MLLFFVKSSSSVIKYLIQVHYFMVSKTKLITSLQQKKYRTVNKLFCRRRKSNSELLDSNFELEHLYSTQNDFEDV
jgi:TrmH family RNA methyltransferase